MPMLRSIHDYRLQIACSQNLSPDCELTGYVTSFWSIGIILLLSAAQKLVRVILQLDYVK